MLLSKPAPSIIVLIVLATLCFVLLLTPSEQFAHLEHIGLSSKTIEPEWLIATISAASSQRRRNIIRATMHEAYVNPRVIFRFVISNPGETWMRLIEHENNTYSDIIMLPHLEESLHIANTIKSIEFLQHATAARNMGWKYISKVDDDSFVAVPAFYHAYISPLLANKTEPSHAESNVVIGRKLQGHRPYAYPGGQFYTMSHKTAMAVVTQYAAKPLTDEDEDVLIGRLLFEAGEEFNITELPNSVAFDFDADIADKWAWSHKIGTDAINPHKMKDDEVYLEVADQMLVLHPGW